MQISKQRIRIEQIIYNSENYHKSVNLREKILMVPLGLKLNKKDLLKEHNDIHIGCLTIDDEIIGILALSPLDNKAITMKQVAIDNNYQNQGIGKQLIKYAENYVKNNGYNKIQLSARKSAISFYKKMGYKIVSEEYISKSTKIPHYRMEKII